MMRSLFKKKFEDAIPTHQGSEFEVNNWITSDFVVNNLVPVVGFHPFPLNELMLMTAAMCYFKPKYVFEWGTNIGKSARIFHEISTAFNIDTKIHSIDLPDEVFHNEHPQKDRGKMVRGIKQVTLHQADGLKKSFEIMDANPTEKRVLFFVDGDHSYATVKHELESILNRLPSAVVLLHDTFYQTPESNYNIGPNKAIQEVLANIKSRHKVVSTNMGLPGMTLVYT